MRVETLRPGLRVATADNPGPLTLEGTRSYLVGYRSALLIDPGPPGPEQQALLDALVGDAELSLVCLTHAHPDHSGAAAELAARYGAEIAGSAETLGRIGLDGRELTDGDEVAAVDGDSRLVALGSPGHTRDHLCYLWLPKRVLFTGDLLLGTGTSVILHPDGDVASYLKSLERLIELEPGVAFPGHGPPVERPVALMREQIEHRLERGRQIEAALDGGAGSVRAIRERVYGPLPPVISRAAEASIRAHLAHIEAVRGRLPTGFGSPGAVEE